MRAVALALACAALACASPAPRGARPAGESDLAAELLRESGLEHQLDVAARSMQASLQAQRPRMAPRYASSFDRALGELSPDVLKLLAHARLAGELEPARAREALAWLRSPIGRRLTSLEEASAAAGPEAAQRFATSPAAAGATVDRITLIDRLNQASGVGRFAGSLAIEAALATAVVNSPAAPTPEQVAGLRAALESQRPAIEQQALLGASSASLFTYHEATDAELASYADFLESEPGSWYARAMTSALLHALTTATQNCVRALGGP